MEKLFHHLEKDVATFQQATSLKCKTACGLCCTKPDISATVLEFLPLAYALAKNNLAHDWLQRVSNHQSNICINLSSLIADNGGFCSNYNHRGLICRLFGFTAMKWKNELQLVTCKTIKEDPSLGYQKATQHIKDGKPTPLISNYYAKLRAIDPSLGSEMMPINEAIEKSIQYVLSYYSYRRIRRTG